MRGSLPSSLKFPRIENLLGPFFLLARFGTNGGKGVVRSFGGEGWKKKLLPLLLLGNNKEERRGRE